MSQDKLDRTIWVPNGEEPVKSAFMGEIERCEKDCIKNEYYNSQATPKYPKQNTFNNFEQTSRAFSIS